MNVFGFIQKGADALKTAKLVFEKMEILLEDADHNGRPDIQEKVELAVNIAVDAGKRHFAEAKEDAKKVGEVLKEIKAKLEAIKAKPAEAKK